MAIPLKVSLRQLLTLPFVLQIIGIVSLTGWLSFRNGQQSIHRLSVKLRQETTQRVEYQINDLLNTAETINTLTAKTIASEQLDLSNIRSLEDLYWNFTTTVETINGLGVGNQKGHIMAFFRQSHNDEITFYQEYSNTETQEKYLSLELDAQRQVVQSTLFDRKIDARKRPWYQAAEQAEKAIWTEIYTSVSQSSEDALLINLSRPIFDASEKLQGVVSVILDLGQISQFLDDIEVSPSGYVYIMQITGELVGSSDSRNPIHRLNGEITRLRADDSQEPLIRASANYLSQEFNQELGQITDNQQLDFLLDGERQFLQLTPFSTSNGIDWLIVVVMPESDFMGQIHANTRNTVLLCLVALGLAIALGVLTSNRITQPIRRLSRAAKRMAAGHFDQWESHPSLIEEVDILTQAFSQMAQHLDESFSALQESEQRYASLASAAPVGIFRHNAKGDCIYINQRCASITGLTIEAAMGDGWRAAIHPDDRERVTNQWNTSTQSHCAYQSEYRFLRPDQTIRWVHTQIVSESDSDGTIIGYVGTITDISDRKYAELQLQSLIEGTAATTGKDFFPALVNHIAEALNVPYAMVTEQVEDQFYALAFHRHGQLRAPFSFPIKKTPCEQALNNGIYYCESSVQQQFPDDLDLAHLQADGYLGIALHSSQGEAIGNLCILDTKPLHNQHRLEQILRVFAARAAAELERQRALDALENLNQALEQKVEERTASLTKREQQLQASNQELESFTYSVSHDLRAPLRHIGGFVTALRSRLEQTHAIQDPKVQHYLNVIDSSSLKMGNLIEGLLTLSRVGRRSILMQTIDLNSLVTHVVDAIQSKGQHGTTAQIANRLPLTPQGDEDTQSRSALQFIIHELPIVNGDETLLYQAFYNLIENAVKFSGDRHPPRIEIGTLAPQATDPQATDSQATIFIKDNGVGFNMTYADQLFGAFQRLHSSEEFPGTGIGLAIVYRIIQQHNGDIWAESQIDHGACFYIKLHCVSSTPKAQG
jgi:PAS domain S-box-containing protein